MKPRVLILHAPGTNRDREAAWACRIAGGEPEIVTVSALLRREANLDTFQMLVLPGGFSFGDDLGAGKVWAVSLAHGLQDALLRFHERRRPILGICNGFQALVKTGLLPGDPPRPRSNSLSGLVDPPPPPRLPAQRVTLTRNTSPHFECRWVRLRVDHKSPCVFTAGLSEDIDCPVAHGEGRLVVGGEDVLAHIRAGHLAPLRYVPGDHGDTSHWNPNGSVDDIAGLTDETGTILGLMPHPEDHILPIQHPGSRRGVTGGSGLRLFEGGLRYAAEL